VRTYAVKASEIERRWYVVDARGKTLGRLASEIAKVLMGKHKPYYSPHLDCGDYVVVVNAAQIRVTGRKLREKMYYRHSLHPGGLKEIPLYRMLEKHPTRVLELAVRRMLPQNRLGRRMFKKLKVYAGSEHPHQAQRPEPLDL